MSKMYSTASPVKHDGKRYAIGDKIELDDKAAAKLLSRGLIGEAPEVPAPKAPEAPEQPKEPEAPKAAPQAAPKAAPAKAVAKKKGK